MKDLFSPETAPALADLTRAWDSVLRRLSEELPSAWLERFIRPLTPVSSAKGVVQINVPGQFVMDWVRKRYLSQIQSFLSDELGGPVVVELVAQSNARAAVTPVQVSSVAVIADTQDRTFRPGEKYTFDNFVVGQSNRLAVAGAKAIAQQPGTKYNPLFIYGPPGLGKTHLLHAIARELYASFPRLPLTYVGAQEFMEGFVAALQNGRIEQFRRSQRGAGVWLLDDIHFIAGRDKTVEEVFHTFNYLQGLGKQIVVTSDRPPRDLHLLDERMRSRFEQGLVADIQMPDTETRCAIILKKAALDNLGLEPSIAMYLAENVPGSVRVLEGALTKLAANASIEDAPITLGLAQAMVEHHYQPGMMAKPAFGQIVNTVGKHFRIPSDEILGLSRKAPIVHARHVAVFVTREITGDSWKHIGTLFGDKDHTSMMHAYQKIAEMMHGDKELRTTVKMLIRNLCPEG